MSDPIPPGTTTLPIRGHERDVAALAAMQSYRAGQLPRVQARAASWNSGITTITGVLATATVIKGVDSFGKLDNMIGILVLVLILVGGALLVWGIRKGQDAAQSDPSTDEQIKEFLRSADVDGAGEAWDEAIESSAQQATKSLASSKKYTLWAVACLGLAFLGTLVGAGSADDSTTTTCIEVAGQRIELGGQLPEVKSGRITVTECPG